MSENSENIPIAEIYGKVTCDGFTIKSLDSLKRTSYFSVNFNNKIYVLSVTKVWRDKSGIFAQLQVMNEIPDTPFDPNSKIRYATSDEISSALGFNVPAEKSIYLGNLTETDIKANFNIEKLGRLFITGKSGSGKSHTVGVIAEEMIKKRIAFLIIDPHGEYSSLKVIKDYDGIKEDPFFYIQDPSSAFSRYIVEFGNTQYNPAVDLGLEYLFACKPNEIISPGQCTIINLRGLSINDQQNLVENLLQKLFQAVKIAEIPPCFIFIDEAHQMAGKQKPGKDDFVPLFETVKQIAQEGRKFGMNLALITQRPQLLDVTIRAQAGTWIIQKLTDVNDINITCRSAEGLSNKDDSNNISMLSTGEAIISGELSPVQNITLKIRPRYTVHGGAGYNILDYVSQEEDIHKADLIDQLKKRITADELNSSNSYLSEKPNASNEIEDLKNQVSILSQDKENLTKQNENLKIDNENLIKQNEILKKQNENLNKQNENLNKQIDPLSLELNKEKKRANDAVKVAEKLLLELKKK